MTSHYPPHLIIDNTHRVMLADTAPEHAQVEEYEPRVYTGDEVLFAFFCGGLFFSLIFAAVAWLIAGRPM